LKGVNSLKAAVVRARAIKEIQEECYDKKRGNLNFARRNFFEKKDQENKKTERKKKNEKRRGSLKMFCVKIKLTIRAERSVGSAESKGISVLNAPTERETRVS